MPAERYNDCVVVRASVELFDVSAECETTRQTSRALCHCGARRVEDTERQNVRLSEQVCYSPSGKLLLEPVVRKTRGVANTVLQPVGPVVISRAVQASAYGTNAGGGTAGAGGMNPGAAAAIVVGRAVEVGRKSSTYV
jgi:hypothetical protein